MENVTVRHIAENEYQEVSALIGKTLLTVNIKDYPAEEMQRLAAFYNRDEIRGISQNAHFYVALENGAIAACGAIMPYLNREDESIITTVFVSPNRQGRGLGRKIMRALEDDVYFKRAVRVQVNSSVTALDFYLRLGYAFQNGAKKLNKNNVYILEKLKYAGSSPV